MNFKTKAAHVGLCKDKVTGAVSTPIYQTATFSHESLGVSTGYDYSRTANPTRKVLEDAICEMEGGNRGFAFATGMSAITAVLMMFSPGDHIIISDDLYGGTYRLIEQIFKRFGLKASYVNTSDADIIESEINAKTKALFVETPTNPLMKITDLSAVVSIAAKNNLVSIVDNTFMTPYFQRPIEFGIDISVHSGTKFLGGHNDVLCGLVVTRTEELSNSLEFIQNSTGGVLGPFDSWLVIRGIKTLAIRLEQQQRNALAVALWLKEHHLVKDVCYPGLEDHPGHDIQKKNATGYGSMISFRLLEDRYVEGLINGVQIITFAESLGGVESLITYPAVQTHGDIPAEMRERIGVTDDLVRLSIGIEALEDIIDDLDRALANCNSNKSIVNKG